MIKFLGLINILLVSVLTSTYWLPRLNRHTLRIIRAGYQSLIGFLRKIHKPLGFVLQVTALAHGMLALGKLSLHTGSVMWIVIFLTSLLGGALYRKRKPALFKWHRRFALLVVLLMLLHLFAPNALSFL